MPLVQVEHIDHIVFNVKQMDKTLDFYVNILGLTPERLDEFNKGEVPFPSVRINAHTIIDFFPTDSKPDPVKTNNPQEINHFCLTIAKTDMKQLAATFEQKGIKITEGPVKRFGAQGQAISIYLQDPEGRNLELRCY